jgi:hypothetical protein
LSTPLPHAGPPGTPAIVRVRGAIVAVAGLATLVVIVVAAFVVIPDDELAGQTIASVATAAFGVIGAVVGAYFGVSAAGNSRDAMAEARRDSETARDHATEQLAAAAAAPRDVPARDVDETDAYGELNPVTGMTGAEVEQELHSEPLTDDPSTRP